MQPGTALSFLAAGYISVSPSHLYKVSGGTGKNIDSGRYPFPSLLEGKWGMQMI